MWKLTNSLTSEVSILMITLRDDMIAGVLALSILCFERTSNKRYSRSQIRVCHNFKESYLVVWVKIRKIN